MLEFADFVPKKLPAPTKTQRVGTGVDFKMFANNRFGCCTFAANGHRVQAQERSSRQLGEIQLTDEDILAGYSAVTGFRREDPATDNGAYMLDVLNYMRKVGLGRERDGTPHTIGAFVRVKPTNRNQWKVAQRMFGGLYIGLWLPTSAQRQERWDVPKNGPTGDGAPGSWGGHAVETIEYDENGVTCATWSERKRMSWRFIDEYCDEAYAVISEDFIKSTGRTPQGFDVDALNAALAELS